MTVTSCESLKYLLLGPPKRILLQYQRSQFLHLITDPDSFHEFSQQGWGGARNSPFFDHAYTLKKVALSNVMIMYRKGNSIFLNKFLTFIWYWNHFWRSPGPKLKIVRQKSAKNPENSAQGCQNNRIFMIFGIILATKNRQISKPTKLQKTKF